MDVITKIIKVDGMTCPNCEKKIEKAIKELDGVIKIKANFRTKTIMIKYDENKVNIKKIELSIEKVGYTKVKPGNNKLVIVAFIIMFGLYLIFKNTNFFNFIPEVKNNINYGLLFIIGLLTSIHCIAMCGGINISVSMNNSENGKFKPGLLYNLGRILSYTIIGGIVGAIGSTLTFSSTTKDLVSIIAGLFMIILGINMTGIFKNINILNIHLPKTLTKYLKNKKKSTKSPFVIGLLNGLIPCGPLQTMQLYALSTGSFVAGASSMLVFALGTLPLMLGLSSLSGLLSGKMGVNLKKLSGVLIVVLGIVMFNRGFDYSILSKLTKTVVDTTNVAVIKDSYQEVTTRFINGSYQPVTVQKGIPVHWIIVIQDGDLNGCNRIIDMPMFNITKTLDYGDNLVIFTPTETGTFRYTCFMHMISSYIYVVDDVALIK